MLLSEFLSGPWIGRALVYSTLIVCGVALYSPLAHLMAGKTSGFRPDGLSNIWDRLWDSNLAALTNALFVTEPPEISELPTVDIWLEPNDLQLLNEEIFRFGFGDRESKTRVDGLSRTEDGMVPVSVSIRGTNAWHHKYWKPSLRLRYKKKNLEGGRRDHILIAPESPTAMQNWVSTQLAERWGMLNYHEEYVRLFMNRRFRGVYTRQWRMDESLLIHAGRLPGPFFRLEFVNSALFKLERSTWDNPDHWEVVGAEADVGRRTMQTALEWVSRPVGAERHRALDDLFDRQAFAKWMSVMCVSGEARLLDHNVAFWLDTTSGKLEPVLIDVGGYDTNALGRPILLAGNPIIRAWLDDPDNVAAYVDALAELLQGVGSTEAVHTMIREQWAETRPDAMADIYTSRRDAFADRSFSSTLALDGEIDDLIQLVEERNQLIWSQLIGTRLFVVEETSDDFEVLVWGVAGAIATSRGGTSASTLLPSAATLGDFQELAPKAYGFFRLPGSPADYDFAQRIGGAILDPEGLDALEYDVDAARAASGTPPLPPPVEPEPVVIGPGEVRWDTDKEFAVGQDVRIVAGTTLLLGPDVSVFIRGRLTVEGTEGAPVRVRPADPARPFGAFAVLGAATAGTRIRHLDMEGGTVGERLNLRLSGMFSVRDCPDLRIEHSRFGPNSVGDDAVHVVRSDAVMVDSLFVDAAGDAVDWDLVTGRVERCTFRDSGNDGLDLSMGDVTVVDSRFERCGDKCVSSGEGNRVFMTGSRLTEGVFGIAIKDSSTAAISDTEFRGLDTGIASYMKKWRWERGGTTWLRDVRIEQSITADVSGDDRSEVRLLGATPALGGLVVEGEVQVESGGEWPGWADR